MGSKAVKFALFDKTLYFSNMKKKLIYLVLAVFATLAAVSCEEDNPPSGNLYPPGNGNELEGCTPLYNGFSTAFGVEQKDLVLYSTDKENQYYIPGFFSGIGGLEFYHFPNDSLAVCESWVGLNASFYPIFVVDQERYLELAGDSAQKSSYDPINGLYTFNIIIETAYDEGMFQTKDVITFKITSEVSAE